MKKKIKTIWQGKVAMPDRLVEHCINQHEDLVFIRSSTEEMTIPNKEIRRKVTGISKEVFKDKFGKKPDYRLYYFQWKMDEPKQDSLF